MNTIKTAFVLFLSLLIINSSTALVCAGGEISSGCFQLRKVSVNGPMWIASGSCGDGITWTLNREGVLTITGEGEIEDYGDAVDDGPPSPWSNYNTTITEIVISEGITSIGSYAFWLAEATKVELPSTLISIKRKAFDGSHIEKIVFPSSLKTIEESAFSDTNIETIELPDTLKNLGGSVFSHCKQLRKVVFEKPMQEIPEGTFCACRSIKEIDIPEGVKSIGPTAFSATGLTSVAIPASVETIGDNAFAGCTALEQVAIAEGLKTINSHAFWQCTNLKELNLPESVSLIQGEAVFAECPQLDIMVIEGSYAERYVADNNLYYIVSCKSHVGEWKTVLPATCTNDGIKERVCSKCGIIETASISATGHKEAILSAVDATCTESGLTEGKKCSVCGEVLEHQKEIAALDHNYDDWQTTKAATEIATGVQTHVCSRCGEKETQEIAQLMPTLKTVKIMKPKAAKKSAAIKWKKISKKNLKKIKKVEIQYSTDKNFKKNVKSKYAKATKTSYRIKNLKSKKKYYVRIRAYTKSGEQVHVSKWSAKKSLKVK